MRKKVTKKRKPVTFTDDDGDEIEADDLASENLLNARRATNMAKKKVMRSCCDRFKNEEHHPECKVGQKPKKLKSFLVSAGNSSKGPVGFCMRVRAKSKAQAIKIAKIALPECIEANDYIYDDGVDTAEYSFGAIEYFNVYFNDAALTVADIEDGETEDA